MNTVPLVILAGRDRRPIRLPASGRDKHPLTGYKGVDVTIGGRPVVTALAERLAACGQFAPIYLAGPASVYGRIGAPVEVVDADSTFSRNIRTAMARVRRSHPDSPVGFTVCDILPDVETLRSVMGDYARNAPCDLWFPLVRKPEDADELGASSWKPAYRIVPAGGERPVRVLPGHLAVVDPGALRLNFLYRLFELGYRTRNRSIAHRREVMVRGVLFALIYQDLRHLVAFKAPTLTWNVLTTGLAAARRLKRGTITRGELETAVRKIFVNSAHRRRFPDRRVLLPLVEALSLALDMDTVEEARAMGGDVPSTC